MRKLSSLSGTDSWIVMGPLLVQGDTVLKLDDMIFDLE